MTPSSEGVTPPRAIKQRIALLLDFAARWTPAAIIAVAALTLLWTRLVALNVSLFDDEAIDASRFIKTGPAGAFSHYIPDDHILFNLLTWAWTNITGDFSNAAYRFWGVVPAIAAAAIMTWWLWRHFDPWVSAIFAVLATASPLYTQLSGEARGYGLAFLAGVVACLAANAYFHHGRRRCLALFAGAGVVGIFTLPVFLLSFLALTGILLLRPQRRRETIVAIGLVGLVSVLFYLPVLGDVLHASGQRFGTQLPWNGVITRPLTDLLAPSVQVLLPDASLSFAGVIAAGILGVGAVTLWLSRRRILLLTILSPALFGYLCLEVGRFYVASRFLSFVMLPLLALAAIALVQAGRLLAGTRSLREVTVALAIAFTLVTLIKTDQRFRSQGVLPIQNFQDAASLALTAKIPRLVTNYQCLLCYRYYLGSAPSLQRLTPAALEHLLCSGTGPFVYLEYDAPPIPHYSGATVSKPVDTACLRQRDAVAIPVAQRRSRDTNVVWIVPKR